MKYASGISRKAIGKRILISWLAIGVIGGGCGYGIAHFMTPKDEIKPLYGVYDRKTIKAEIEKNFGRKLNFTPLNVPMGRDMQEFVFYLCTAYKMDFTFVMAVIDQESGFRIDTISETNDYGLMQINECNFEMLTATFGITNFLEPYSNIRGGVWMLNQLFKKYQTPEKVLMAYNMGEHGAAALWERGIYETAYTRAISQKQAKYQDEVKGALKND